VLALLSLLIEEQQGLPAQLKKKAALKVFVAGLAAD
jgi:hypothetical protein